jgi:hypothetical protein
LGVSPEDVQRHNVRRLIFNPIPTQTWR